MRGLRPLSGFLLCGTMVLAGVGACASDPTDAPIPSRADSGFLLRANAFPFENFADGYESSRMTPSLTARMFGDEVCVRPGPDCELVPAARIWENRINAAMSGGRCEGFVVLSSLFFSGATDPKAFGADAARKLTLDSNVPLQEELAYWYATQGALTAGTTRKLGATEALRFLSTILTPGASESYRIGIVRKTKGGLRGGHAITPIRYEPSGREGVYLVHVYDNNYPDEDRTLEIDTIADRWSYRASANPNEAAALYTGDPNNKNPLYFAPIRARLGRLPAPFAPSASESQTTFGSAVSGVAREASGSSAGVNPDGEVVETGAGVLSPSFSALDTWSPPSTVDVHLPKGDTVIELGPSEGSGSGVVSHLGPGYAVEASNLRVTAKGDVLIIERNGHGVRYVNASSSPLRLRSAVRAEDGHTLEVEVVTPRGSREVTTTVEPTTGEIKVTADGTAGQEITIAVTKVEGGTSASGSLVIEGSETGTVTLDTRNFDADTPFTARRTSENGTTTPIGSTCSDGTKNGAESDVDCGGTCSVKCAEGKSCIAAGDCISGACNATTNLCVPSTCVDALKNGSESDVDCGGLCSARCALGKQCVSTTDCASGTCEVGRCTSIDRYVFVTSGTSNANLGGLAGADAKCQSAALGAGLPGTYKAFLSDRTASATGRISRGLGRYVLTDGGTVVANDAAGFFASTHLAGIDRSETKTQVGAVEVWTGSQGPGAADGTAACADWTDAASVSTPYAGRTDLFDERWLSLQFSACNGVRHLYCVQEGPVPPP